MHKLYNPWPEVIAQMRLAKGLIQEQAAEAADVSTNTWHRWERPRFLPNEKQLEKIVLGLGCTPDELGSAFAMAMAKKYLALFEGGGAEDAPDDEDEAPAAPASPRRSGETDLPLDPFDALLGSVVHVPEPDDLETLIRGTLGKSFSVIAAIIAMLTELITCWPRFRAEASEEDQRHVMLVRTHLHQLLDLCLSVSEELHQIAGSRGVAA